MTLCKYNIKKKHTHTHTITSTQLGPLNSCSFQIIDSIYVHVISKCLRVFFYQPRHHSPWYIIYGLSILEMNTLNRQSSVTLTKMQMSRLLDILLIAINVPDELVWYFSPFLFSGRRICLWPKENYCDFWRSHFIIRPFIRSTCYWNPIVSDTSQ
jgi:hypothetical protein